MRVKLNGSNGWKWTIVYKTGWSKRLQLDDLRKWTVMNSIRRWSEARTEGQKSSRRTVQFEPKGRSLLSSTVHFSANYRSIGLIMAVHFCEAVQFYPLELSTLKLANFPPGQSGRPSVFGNLWKRTKAFNGFLFLCILSNIFLIHPG